jgi:conjugative transfer pilus assembly protein TraH
LLSPKSILIAAAIGVCGAGSAEVGSDLEKFFSESAIVTRPGASRDQSAGYYSGGGITVRNRVKNAQLATINLPDFKAGCGGIDIYMGGFSHIDAAALVNMLKNIGSAAKGYAFKLAMKTVAPMLETVLEDLNDLATKINQANINSCEVATTLLDGLWPRKDLAERHACTSSQSNVGDQKSWNSAREKCGRDGIKAKEKQDILVENFNVAWEVVKKNPLIAKNRELAFLCMTVTGTIVSKQNNKVREVKTWPGKADSDDLIKALFEGGTVEIYACSDFNGKCLDVKKEKLNVIQGAAFHTKIHSLLKSITDKAIRDDNLDEFDKTEKNFIEKVRLPIYKMINVFAAKRRADFDLRDFTEVIAIDYIHQYILELLDLVLEESVNLKNAQVSDDDINRFIDQIQRAKKAINSKRMNAYEQMNQMLLVIERARIEEKEVENTFNALQKGAD